MKMIPLSQGYHAQVDDDDYEWLMEWKWYANVKKNRGGDVAYAVRKRMNVTISMAVELAKRYGFYQENREIKHLDGNKLNYQKVNMTSALGPMKEAVPVPVKRSSQFKGVSWDVTKGRWQAILVHQGVKHHLGRFTIEQMAARAYDRRATELMGKTADLNFPKVT